MVMIATVNRVNRQSLLVTNEQNGEEVLVYFRNAGAFSPGDRISITFNGQMTFSIPPQITATSIQRMGRESAPSQMRAVVLQRGRDFLIVRNAQTGQQFRVDYAFAHHFCARQQITVRYDTLTLGNPPRVTATDIIPIC